MSAVDILDLRAHNNPAGTDDAALRAQIVAGLTAAPGNKTLPTMLLYDEHGLRLYDAITTDAEEYYLFAAEEHILAHNADDIVRTMHAGTPATREHETVVELGAG